MLDADGFRPNVGIVVANGREQVLFARRVGGFDAWQFPQGGIQESETPEDALYRELDEEVGLDAACVEIVAETQDWLRYELPPQLRRSNSDPGFIGQKQKWFLLRMLADDSRVDVHRFDEPEFDHWQWVSYWYPVSKVIAFKRDVYRKALAELAPALREFANGPAPSATAGVG
ncbi:MAG: RNA pyrophosphohydrolase [Gammaproteobacteria bacterium]|nr:RNA pyrophosphohydrolase [Gammaproteobacteria bacterium]